MKDRTHNLIPAVFWPSKGGTLTLATAAAIAELFGLYRPDSVMR